MKLMIYDSGVGGEVVYHKLREIVELDQLSTGRDFQLDFFADHANFPYGRKTEAELQQVVQTNLQRFFSEGYDCVGIACNTASIIVQKHSFRLNDQIFTIVQPTVEKVLEFDLQPVHIIASQFTITQRAYSQLIQAAQPDWIVSESAEQELIEAIENDDARRVEQEVIRIVKDLSSDVKTVVLACTHFSKIKIMFEYYREEFHKTFAIVDSAEVLVEELVQVIAKA